MSEHATTPTLTAYLQYAEPLAAVVADLTAPQWAAPSPCAGWSAADVVDHVVTTQRDYFERHQGDLGPAPELAADPAAGWRTHDAAVRRVLADPALVSRAFDGFFGPTTVGELFVQFYGFDLIVHRWDVARSAGRDERFSDAELDTVERAIAGFGEHLYGEGICARPVEVPLDADRQTRVLATLGRKASTLAL
ncbi:MAG: TIGR03086 family protein [Austwickia sp.]|jgi:uncharacterized protein (TIGR03086 family)|nr:TIGR03086 family protein [Austwickia sp.]MBK8437442.1 TIGR03086 family protein [Austwickia sp.]